MQDEKDLLKMRTVIGNNQIFPGAYLVLMQVVHPADFIHIILQRIVMPVRITQGNGCKRVARINQDTGKILVTDRGTFLPGVRKKAKSKNTEKTGNTNSIRHCSEFESSADSALETPHTRTKLPCDSLPAERIPPILPPKFFASPRSDT